VHGRPYLSFCPISLQHFQVFTSMQMDAYLEEEQIGTLFVLVGAPEGGFRGGGPGGSSSKIIHAYPNFFWRLLYTAEQFWYTA